MARTDRAKAIADPETIETLKQALVLSLHRLDYSTLHVKWLPAFEAILVLLVGKTDKVPLDYWTLFCVYSACVCPDMKLSAFKNSTLQKNLSRADKVFESFWKRVAEKRNFAISYDDIPLLAYGISRVTFVAGDRVDSKNPVYRLLNWLTNNMRMRVDKS